ncbi:MAG: hypothetical protein ACXAC5_11895 [Promethearchaeota archaeon]
MSYVPKEKEPHKFLLQVAFKLLPLCCPVISRLTGPEASLVAIRQQATIPMGSQRGRMDSNHQHSGF